MKKILLLLIAITFSTNLYADKLLKNGFLNNKMSYAEDRNINDPTNKIILIYNHGQILTMANLQIVYGKMV